MRARDDEGARDEGRPGSSAGGPYADDPMAALIVHINREVMHHGAEIALLRDLCRATGAKTPTAACSPRPNRPAARRLGRTAAPLPRP